MLPGSEGKNDQLLVVLLWLAGIAGTAVVISGWEVVFAAPALQVEKEVASFAQEELVVGWVVVAVVAAAAGDCLGSLGEDFVIFLEVTADDMEKSENIADVL